MSRAYLNFEDMPGGRVAVLLRTEGPVNANSKAHAAAITLLEEFEKHAERLADPEVTVDPLREIDEGLAEYNPLIIAPNRQLY